MNTMQSSGIQATSDQPLLLNVKNLRVHLRIGDQIVRAVDGVDLELRHGECVGIVGESGSGKSTTARAITRLMPNVSMAEFSGDIRFNGRDLLGMADRDLRRLRKNGGFSMIFQDPLGYLNPTQRIGKQIGEAVSREGNALSRDQAVWSLLDEVGLPDAKNLARRYPHELSGGMRQRVMIAIALASRPKLLFADEPTTALDATVQMQVLQTLYRVQRERNMAVVIITHDLGVVAELCDRVYVMHTGKVIETAATQDLFATPQHAYSAQLINLSTRLNPMERLT
ncbi:ABC transporter ATP-binding protein [Rhizobium ruizarguesonis]|uniref:ABC transporter ATP-binding protein n=1 Tax=Rhizobium ruizarguesonis TaxID=2081791 RepID=UPI001CF56470|nr:ABC transporter ATP-binding protein [Rhizobium ruizarguesonis]MCB2402279.1 ABC transporter ATP-binding protein [Rhizobium ruizarguesonis]